MYVNRLVDPAAIFFRQVRPIKILQFIFLLLMLSVCDVSISQAASVKVTFSGTVDLILGNVTPGINLNDPVSGTLIYNSDIPDGNPDSQIGYYPDAITSYVASIGSKSFSLVPSTYSPRSEIAIEDNVPLYSEYTDYIRFLGGLFEDGYDTFYFLELGFRTVTSTPSSWIDTASALPTDIDLNAADNRTGHIRLDPFSANHATFFTITSASVSMIPVPPAVWLFGSGLFGLIGVARRKAAA